MLKVKNHSYQASNAWRSIASACLISSDSSHKPSVVRCKTKRLNTLENKRGKECEDETSRLQNDCYSYIASFSKEIYENELQRKESIVHQASNTQTSFSFASAALLMAAPVIVEYRGTLSLTFLFMAFSSILMSLLLSLLFATIALNTRKRMDYPSIKSFKENVESNYLLFQTSAQRNKYLCDTYEQMQTSLERSNEARLAWIKKAYHSFYCALFLCVLWFAVAVMKMI